ncbi:cytochrome P450 76AD1-like [Amaranthus tricolor]|uniref:cytochrome P450 76AD1-like n=1 Tax=Amaranthus tricolor TaxID=29722 RepID=UPI0025849090|nr:cytochrome P450 76AD1-like [Amaranthus tricolor]
MECFNTITLFLFFVFSIIFFTKFTKKSKNTIPRPPGPKPWPIIGNIHLLGTKPHRSITKLSKIYGPIMSLKLGRITTIVISSPEIAKEMFLKHDLEFSGRRLLDATRATNHNSFSLVFLPVCPKWRKLKKIATIQLLTTQGLDAGQHIRAKKVSDLKEYVTHCYQNGVRVDIGKVAFTTSLNLLSNTLFSMDMATHDSLNSQQFKDLIWHIMEETGKPNVSDFFPILRCFDLQGVYKRTSVYFNKMLDMFGEIIDERLKTPKDPKDDVLNTLLKLVEDNELSLEEVKHLLLDLFVAGTDTSSIVFEWAMTELLRNPEKMKMAQIEIDQVFGKDKIIQESEFSKLPFIQAIVKETMRLHAPGPFLLPHMTDNDVELCGYFVPKHAQVLINVWSIGRDPMVWSNPLMFMPERFIEKEVDLKGRDFKFLPFGEGRRICPGMTLAYRMLNLMLATLLQSFNWKYHDNEEVDVEDKFGMSLHKAIPLLANPIPR